MTATDFASEVNAFGVFFDKQKKCGMNVSWQSSCRTFNLDVGQTKQVGALGGVVLRNGAGWPLERDARC